MVGLALLLAQMCVAEIGFTQTTDDVRECEVMWSIQFQISERSGVKIERVIRSYNSAFRIEGTKADNPRARWVRGLSTYPARPDGWPEDQARWSIYRRIFAEMIDDAQLWLDADRPHPFAEDHQCRMANHYGGDMDQPKSKCWFEVYCGETKQTFWVARNCPVPIRRKTTRPPSDSMTASTEGGRFTAITTKSRGNGARSDHEQRWRNRRNP